MSLPPISVALLLLALGAATLSIATAGRARPTRATRTVSLCLGVALALVGHARLLQRGEDGGLALREPPPHLHEFFHYYLGTKYFAELGYTGLYAATVLADLEDEPERFRPGERVRDLATNRPEPRARAAERGREVRRRFSAERWRDFKRDLALIRDANPPDLWDRRGYVMDHGYNGTPLSTVVLGGLANQDRVETGVFIGLARWLDLYLLCLAGLLVMGLEGPAIGLAFLLFTFANPLNDYAFVGGAYLRYGYLLALAGALLALRRGFAASAGALLALATGLRLFPIVFYAAIALHALLRPDRWARLRAQRRLHAGFAAAGLAIAIAGAAVETPTGRPAWIDFADEIARHGRTPVANLIGVQTVFAYAPAKDRHPPLDEHARARPGSEDFDWAAETRRVLERRRPLQLAAICAAGLGIALWLRRVREDETFLPALAVLFTTLPMAHYYWALACLLPLAHPRRRDLQLGLAALFAAWLALAAEGLLDQRLDLKFTIMSLVLAAFLGFAALRTIRPPAAVAAAVALAIALAGCAQPQPEIEGDTWRSRAFGVSIEKPPDWVFLPETSLRYDARWRIRDRAELRERLDWPGKKPLVALASRENPVPGRDAIVYVHVIPVRANENPRGLKLALSLASWKAVKTFIVASSGDQDRFVREDETRPHSIAGIEGAEVDATYRTHENGTAWPTRERMAHLKRGEEFWYVRRIGPDPFPPELERQFDRIVASLQLED